MITAEQVQNYRAETPGCKHAIHLNNAGTGLPPLPVLKSMQDYLQLEAEKGGYETSAMMSDQLHDFYTATARLLNAKAHQVAFLTSATDAFNQALSAIPFEKGDLILTTNDDYISNHTAFWALAKRMGLRVMRGPTLPGGGCDPEGMIEFIRQHRPRLVSVTHIPTNSGLIQAVAPIGQVCREEGIWYLVDACQSVGQMPVDVKQIQCDFLSATLRKFLRGPRGAGFLYVSDRALEAGLHPLLPDMRGVNWVGANEFELVDSAKRFELWEKSYALMIGSKVAIEYALAIGLDRIEKRLSDLANYLRGQLAQIDGLRLLDRGKQPCALVTFHPEGFSAEAFKAKLDARQINTSIANRSSAQIDFIEKQVEWALRASPHYYNTKGELDTFVEAVRQMIKK